MNDPGYHNPAAMQGSSEPVHNRILITEDDPVIAEATSRHLRTWGWETYCTEDFSDVLGEVNRFRPDLILMDVSLPFFNGYHCGARKSGRFPGCR